MPRAGGEVDHHVASLGDELLKRHLAAVEPAGAQHRVGPDILANRDADTLAVVYNDTGRGSGLEVTVFVKNIVGRQQTFAGNRSDLTPVTEGGGVVERATLAGGIEFDRADQSRRLADRGGDLGEGVGHVWDKAALEEQVAGRIAADRELRKDHQLRALRDEFDVGVEDAPAVTGEVANDRVELG